MAKSRIVFTCKECGHEETKWLGRCPNCGSWNSFRENIKTGKGGSRQSGAADPGGRTTKTRHLDPIPIDQIEYSDYVRIDSGIDELNRVLGGGIMMGASVLIGGEPGIGKSTLMLQLAAAVEIGSPVLYISGEESAQQIRMRAERLHVITGHFSKVKKGEAAGSNIYHKDTTIVANEAGKKASLHLVCESDLDRILSILNRLAPAVVVVDSIQTLVSQEAGSIPGTVNQLKYGCHELIDWAREKNTALFLVAHVTKEGTIAGPKVIEHMVDTVLYFEQADTGVRIVRAVKNRHGSVDEIGLFTMERDGLIQVKNPVSFFLQQRKTELPPGIIAAPVYEGSRVLMVEIQALVVPAKSGFSRIYSDKIDSNRVSRIAAVLEKNLSVRFSDQDIYVNVAGGIRLVEVGIELPLAIALYSARTGIAVPREVALAGEISLAGEIRPTAHIHRRIKTASEMGFKKFFGPGDVHARDSRVHREKPDSANSADADGVIFTRVEKISDTIKVVFGAG